MGEWGDPGDMLEGEEDAREFNDRGFDCCPLNIPDYGTDGYKKADNVFEDLVGMINKSYPDLLEPNYSETNQCWTLYYFITRDYQLKTACTMTHDLGEDNKVLKDFSKIQPDDADSAEEKEAIKQIEGHIKSIKELLGRVKTEA